MEPPSVAQLAGSSRSMTCSLPLRFACLRGSGGLAVRGAGWAEVTSEIINNFSVSDPTTRHQRSSAQLRQNLRVKRSELQLLKVQEH